MNAMIGRPDADLFRDSSPTQSVVLLRIAWFKVNVSAMLGKPPGCDIIGLPSRGSPAVYSTATPYSISCGLVSPHLGIVRWQQRGDRFWISILTGHSAHPVISQPINPSVGGLSHLAKWSVTSVCRALCYMDGTLDFRAAQTAWGRFLANHNLDFSEIASHQLMWRLGGKSPVSSPDSIKASPPY